MHGQISDFFLGDFWSAIFLQIQPDPFGNLRCFRIPLFHLFKQMSL